MKFATIFHIFLAKNQTYKLIKSTNFAINHVMIERTIQMNPVATITLRQPSSSLDEVVVGTFMGEGLGGVPYKDKRFPHS